MSTPATMATPLVAVEFSAPSVSLADTARRLFLALGPLHRLRVRDSLLLERAASAHRFIRTMSRFDDQQRATMQLALRDLPQNEADVVEASAGLAVDAFFECHSQVWHRLEHPDRRRALWFAALLRLAEGLDSVCGRNGTAVYAAWTDDVLHLEVDGDAFSEQGIDRALGRVAALEAVSQRRVLLTSSARRRGAA